MKSGQCYPIGLCLDCQGRIKSSLFLFFSSHPTHFSTKKSLFNGDQIIRIRPMIWSVCMFSMMSNVLRPFSFLFSAWASLTDFSGVPIIERTRRKNLAPLPLYFSLHKRELDNEDLRRWWASWSVRLLGHHRFRPLKKKKRGTLSYCHSNSEQLLALSLKQKNMLSPGGGTGSNSPSVRVLSAFSIVYVRVLCARARTFVV